MFSKAFAKFTTKTTSFSAVRNFASESLLKARLREVVPQKQAELKQIKQTYGNESLGDITVDQAIGGMRNMFSIIWDSSLLTPKDGITFRGYSIRDLCSILQTAPNGQEPLCEGLLWLIMTGDIPKDSELADLQREIQSKSAVPKETEDFIARLPKDMHPMTQLSTALLHLQTGSKFAAAYRDGVHKSKYWDVIYEDCIDLIAKLPRIAALIYRHVYKGGKIIAPDSSLDWAGNYSHMMGYQNHEMLELIRGYLTIHSDHEGGNVSAHTTHLVGSALSDPYLSYSAGLNGLAGPLHGLANQEVLRWLLDLLEELGGDVSEQKVRDFAQRTLSSGKVIPGYGHAVLRHTDPRYTHLRDFATRYIKNDKLVELCKTVFKVVPPILQDLGKVKNPWPNVDAHSGVLLYHYGMTEFDYYTVVFAVSRALGCMTNLFWARAFGFPIERPGSITLQWIKDRFSKEGKSEK